MRKNLHLQNICTWLIMAFTISQLQAQTLEPLVVGKMEKPIRKAAIGDFNKDGKNEIAVGVSNAAMTNSYVVIYRFNNGKLDSLWATEWTGYNFVYPSIGDTDSDGDHELIISADGGDNGGFVKIFEYQGNNEWTEAWSVNAATIRCERGVSVGDADNDGKNELVVGVDWYGRKLMVFEHISGNTYQQSWSTSGNDFKSTLVADCDNYGDMEILAGTGNWDWWDWRIYSFNGTTYQLSYDSEHLGHTNCIAGDADNDGLNEIIVSSGYDNGGENNLKIYKWQNNSFEEIWAWDANIPSYSPTLGALLVNGKNQVITFSGRMSPYVEADSCLHMFEYNGTDWTEIWTSEKFNSSFWGDCQAGDIDNDGNEELIFCQYETGMIIYDFNDTHHKIWMDDAEVMLNTTFTAPVYTSGLAGKDSIIAYQFSLDYDASMLQYKSATLDGTIAAGGSLSVNHSTQGKLYISYMNTTFLSGSGEILKFKFKTLKSGTTTPLISNFLYNTDTVTDVKNALITIGRRYGDVDYNGYVQAYDAALALQYSVGLEPLPAQDPLPWDDMRVKVADVDAVGGVTANDASLILQYSAWLINTFPAENNTKKAALSQADVSIAQEGDRLVFRANGELYGLNVVINENKSLLGTPEILDHNFISAININQDNYRLGLATANAPAEGTAIMAIPIQSAIPLNLNFEIVANTETKYKTISTTTSVAEIDKLQFRLYPNPVSDVLHIEVPEGFENAEVYIISLDGKKVYSGKLNADRKGIDVRGLAQGVYQVVVDNGKERFRGRFVRK